MDGVSWIKLQTNIFDNEKIIAIENMPDGDALLVIWLKLLALAGKCNSDGMVFVTNDIPYTDQLLANRFNKPLTTVQLALSVFERFHMIEIVDDIVRVSNWAKYQNVDGLEKIREQGRLRAKAYRDKQKTLVGCEQLAVIDSNVTNNVTDNVTEALCVTQSSYSLSNSNSNSSSKKQKKIDETPVVFQLMLNDATMFDVHESLVDECKSLYPNADVEQEFRNMIGWINGNPTRRKTRTGIKRFIHSWLSRSQNTNRQSNRQNVGANGVKLASERDNSLDGIF